MPSREDVLLYVRRAPISYVTRPLDLLCVCLFIPSLFWRKGQSFQPVASSSLRLLHNLQLLTVSLKHTKVTLKGRQQQQEPSSVSRMTAHCWWLFHHWSDDRVTLFFSLPLATSERNLYPITICKDTPIEIRQINWHSSWFSSSVHWLLGWPISHLHSMIRMISHKEHNSPQLWVTGAPPCACSVTLNLPSGGF